MKKIRIGLVGGAFDPITLSHIKLAKCVLGNDLVDVVWIVPCYSHSYNKKMATPQQRLDMCDLAVKSNIVICDYEIYYKMHGSAYEFVTKLFSDYSEMFDFYYIIGMDNANTIDKWINYKELIKTIPFIVVNRQGIIKDENVTWYHEKPHISLLTNENDIPNMSSTMVREFIAQEKYEEAKKLVDPNVFKYIMDNGLYRKSMKVITIKNCSQCPKNHIRWDDDDGFLTCGITNCKDCGNEGIPDWCPLLDATIEQEKNHEKEYN